jgi:hypothetical protein
VHRVDEASLHEHDRDADHEEHAVRPALAEVELVVREQRERRLEPAERHERDERDADEADEPGRAGFARANGPLRASSAL